MKGSTWERCAAASAVLLGCLRSMSVGEGQLASGGQPNVSSGGKGHTGGSAAAAGDSATNTGGDGGAECSKSVQSTAVNSPDDTERLRGVSVVQGTLRVGGTVSDLDALTCLEAVEHLEIVGTSRLEHLDGLSNLSVVRSLKLQGNLALKDISALRKLGSIAGDVTIQENPELESLAGLDQIVRVDGTFLLSDSPEVEALTGLSSLGSAGNLHIFQMPGLVDMTGLEGLTTVDEELSISGSERLQTVRGLENLRAVVRLTLSGNSRLRDLSGLDQLRAFSDLYLGSNASLETLDGLSPPATLVGAIIEENPRLRSLEALSKVEEISGIGYFWDLPNVTTLSGFRQLARTGGGNELAQLIFKGLGITNLQGLGALEQASQLGLADNAQLTTLSGLNPAVTLHSFSVGGSPMFTDLGALSRLTQLKGGLGISDCDSFSDLSPLQQLTSVGTLGLGRNAALTSLRGLAGLRTITANLTVHENPLLSTCEVAWLRANLINDVPEQSVLILGNADVACTP